MADNAEVIVAHICVELVATGDGGLVPRVLADSDVPITMQMGLLEHAKLSMALEQFAYETGLFDEEDEDDTQD